MRSPFKRLSEWSNETPEGLGCSGCLLVAVGLGVLLWAVFDPSGFFDYGGGPPRTVVLLLVAPIGLFRGGRKLYRLYRRHIDA